MDFFRLDRKPVYLRPEFTRKLARQRYETVDGMATRWSPPDGSDKDDYPPQPSESTIQSWITNGFPSKLTGRGRYSLLAFCAQLDVDPLALFDFQRNGYFSHFGRIRKAVQRGVGALGGFGPLFELLEPDQEWPSNCLAKKIWGRDWFIEEFDNTQEYKLNSYALLDFNFEKTQREIPESYISLIEGGKLEIRTQCGVIMEP